MALAKATFRVATITLTTLRVLKVAAPGKAQSASAISMPPRVRSLYPNERRTREHRGPLRVNRKGDRGVIADKLGTCPRAPPVADDRSTGGASAGESADGARSLARRARRLPPVPVNPPRSS